MMSDIKQQQAAKDKILGLYSDMQRETGEYLEYTQKRLERFNSRSLCGLEAGAMRLFYDKTLMEQKRDAIKAFNTAVPAAADSKKLLDTLESQSPKTACNAAKAALTTAEKDAHKCFNFLGSRSQRLLTRNQKRFARIEKLFGALETSTPTSSTPPSSSLISMTGTPPANYEWLIKYLMKDDRAPELAFYDQIDACRVALLKGDDASIAPALLKKTIRYLQFKEMEEDLKLHDHSIFANLDPAEKETLLKQRQLYRDMTSLVNFAAKQHAADDVDFADIYRSTVTHVKGDLLGIQTVIKDVDTTYIQHQADKLLYDVEAKRTTQPRECVIEQRDLAPQGLIDAFVFERKIRQWLTQLADFTKHLFEVLSKPNPEPKHPLCTLSADFILAAFSPVPDSQVQDLVAAAQSTPRKSMK